MAAFYPTFCLDSKSVVHADASSMPRAQRSSALGATPRHIVANLATFHFGAVGSRDIHVVAAALMLAVMVARGFRHGGPQSKD